MDRYTPDQRREYMKQYRDNLRNHYVTVLGGKCVVCGSENNLQFDHIDPETKLFNISGFSKSRAMIDAEITKCQLLCEKHHSEKSVLEATQTEHGTTMYRNGCRCNICRNAAVSYVRNKRQNTVTIN